MLYVSFESSVGIKNIEWHIGDVAPPTEGPVIVLQADGDELELIEAAFRNIPYVYAARVVTWTGDIAQFIYDNLSNIRTH